MKSGNQFFLLVSQNYEIYILINKSSLPNMKSKIGLFETRIVNKAEIDINNFYFK